MKSIKKPTYQELEQQIIELKRVCSASDRAKQIAEAELNHKKNNVDSELLKSSFDFLDKIINNVYAPIFVKDSQSRFTHVNEAFCNIFGLTKDEILGRTLAEHIPIDEQEHFLRIDKEVLETGEESMVEETLTVMGISSLTILTKKTRFRNSLGDIFLIGVIHDITDIKNKELELIKLKEKAEESESKLAEIFNNINEPLWLIDVEKKDTEIEMKLSFINNAFTDIFGVILKDSEGGLLENQLPKQILDIVLPRYLNVIGNEETYKYQEVLNLPGGRKAFETTLVPIFDDNNVMTKFLGIAYDKTDIYNANFSLQEKEVLLKEIHHRVKNNLQIITGLLELQSSSILDEKVKELFRSSQHRINAMSGIHEMLYQGDSLSNIDYSDYLNNLFSTLLLSMKGSNSDIQFNIKVDSIKLNIDTAIPLGLIINEIATNSLKHGVTNDSDGIINVEINKMDLSNYEMLIGDNGVGISNNAGQGGKTLGLKLIKQLTKQLKGSIELDESKQGTNYIIKFQEINLESK
jgi:PAS domain S-box-containing protein